MRRRADDAGDAEVLEGSAELADAGENAGGEYTFVVDAASCGGSSSAAVAQIVMRVASVSF